MSAIHALLIVESLVGLGLTSWIFNLPTWHYRRIVAPQTISGPLTRSTDTRGLIL